LIEGGLGGAGLGAEYGGCGEEGEGKQGQSGCGFAGW
jgi:hypothetical protein